MEKQTYPRIPENNWWTLREQFKKSLPTTVTISYLKSLLNLASEKSASNLLAPLKQIGLIGEDGKPTKRANDWRNDEKYVGVCSEIIAESYPKELIELFPDNDIDKDKLVNWFAHTGQLGDVAAKQSAMMFILLKSGLNANESKGKVEKKSTTKEPSKKKVNTISQNDKPVKTLTGEIDSDKPTVHIDLQIHISPSSTPEQIEKIFESISKHLYKK